MHSVCWYWSAIDPIEPIMNWLMLAWTFDDKYPGTKISFAWTTQRGTEIGSAWLSSHLNNLASSSFCSMNQLSNRKWIRGKSRDLPRNVATYKLDAIPVTSQPWLHNWEIGSDHKWRQCWLMQLQSCIGTHDVLTNMPFLIHDSSSSQATGVGFLALLDAQPFFFYFNQSKIPAK